MTIDVTRFRESTYLKPHKKTFFPLKIPLQHHQLRHYISVADGGIIYYISGCDVWALHTKLHKRERIASLAFQPQCLGAGLGWICVGGLNGRCAFIDITDAQPFTYGRGPAPARGEVDELLPLNLDPQPRDPSDPVESRAPTHRPAWSRARVHPRQIGDDIVNAITLHRMKSPFNNIEDEDIAVVSTNVKVVQIFSLSQLRVVKTLSFDHQMNHATISPDGKTMVACGDDMYAYFFQRCESQYSNDPLLFDKYEWGRASSCVLKATVPPDTCFSTAFSPSGHLCTIASQWGVLTVFDVEKVRDCMENGGDVGDAVVDTFTSTRPHAGHDEMKLLEMPGAIRSAAFSPSPWDLLAWAEDQGRVCVTDLRDGFRSRQLLELDITSKDFEDAETIHVEELETTDQRELEIEASMLRRQQHAADIEASINSTTDYIEHAANRRRRQYELTGSAHDSQPHDLTETERQILETLRVERLRETAASESRQTPHPPYSVNYNSSSPNRIQEYMQARNLERTSSASSLRGFNPRRQSSIVIANSNNPQRSSSSSLAPLTGNSYLSSSPSRLGSSSASHTPAPASPSSSRPTSFTTTGSSLIPAPTSGDPWAMTTDQSVAASIRASRRSRTPPTSTVTPAIDIAFGNRPAASIRSLMDEDEAQRGTRSDSDQPRRRGSSHLGTTSTVHLPRSHQHDPTPSSYPYQELEEARAQIVRLSAQVEADTEDVLRQLRHRALEQVRDRPRGGGTRLYRPGQNDRFTVTDDGERPAQQSPMPQQLPFNNSTANTRAQYTPTNDYDERDLSVVYEGDGRLDAVRMAQYRRIQNRAAGTGSGRRDRDDSSTIALNEAFMHTMLGTRREHGHAIVGLGWGEGGRSFYVATEEGIFAFELDVDQRKQFPSIKLK